MASGESLVVVVAANAASVLTTDATHDERNNQICLDFDAAANETARFTAVMPRNYAGGGITITTHWAMSSATSLTLDVDTEIERQAGLDLDGDSFAAAVSKDNTTVPGTAGQEFTVANAHTDGAQMDSLAVGEQFRLRITRDAVADDAAGDAELWTVEIRET